MIGNKAGASQVVLCAELNERKDGAGIIGSAKSSRFDSDGR